MIYLYANNSVFDFYPKFGFEEEIEYEQTTNINSINDNARKLNMDNSEDVKLLESHYLNGNPYSLVPMLNNFGLLMFYCSSFMKDCVYYIDKYDTIVIGEIEDYNFNCSDIFSPIKYDLMDILSSVDSDLKTVTMGFTTISEYKFNSYEIKDNNSKLFVYKKKGNFFKNKKIMLPKLSHS